MAFVAKDPKDLQVFRGSRPKVDVFTATAGDGCCGTGPAVDYDKLDPVVRFDNALAHQNPTGANDKYHVPYGNGFDINRDSIIQHINKHGVGARVSVLAIPTYALIRGVAIHISGAEDGLTFNLKNRNSQTLLGNLGGKKITGTRAEGDCVTTRAAEDIDQTALEGFGALPGGARTIDLQLFAKDTTNFAVDSDALQLEVATMPASGKVAGDFDIQIAVSYDVVRRAER